MSIALVIGVFLQLFTIIGGLWALARRLARLEMMVDLMWEEFSHRFGVRRPGRRK
jgi:hypothetical protein